MMGYLASETISLEVVKPVSCRVGETEAFRNLPQSRNNPGLGE